MQAQSFSDSQTALNYLQSKYGSANYNSWQSLRKEWWSFVPYLEAGASVYTFFGDAVGQNAKTKQDTNLPKSGSLGQNHFLLKSLRCDIQIADLKLQTAYATDASQLYSDILNGFVHAGVLELVIGDRIFVQIPKPFMYAPPADGRCKVHGAGVTSITLNEAAPNTLNAYISVFPFATLNRRQNSAYIVDPNILIEAEQHFEVRTRFDSGAVPVIGTGVTDDATNPLKIGVMLDGITFRPVQ